MDLGIGKLRLFCIAVYLLCFCFIIKRGQDSDNNGIDFPHEFVILKSQESLSTKTPLEFSDEIDR
jgi:hypothetical protein